MPGTYSQIYIQIVFAVKGRENLIGKSWKDELHKYISGIITNKGQKSIIVNGFSDHVHIFVGLKPSMAISDLVRDVKNNSSNFINDRKFVLGRFSWQEGYGAFSYAHSQIEQVYNYILNQEQHHNKKTFKEEYLEFLEKFEIEYNEKYLFECIHLTNPIFSGIRSIRSFADKKLWIGKKK
jgi:REP element-mobilizing transposase RayT